MLVSREIYPCFGSKMKHFGRDIRLTLIIKLALLMLLWFFCFKGAEKNKISADKWLFGSDSVLSKTVKKSNVQL